jgi:ADP-ribose pyrophosphatase YjhB (NUDIX family)
MSEQPTPNTQHPTPRIVVAVGAIVTQGEHILLIQRGHPPGDGLWSIPGGRVELGETLAEAVRREIHEECGLDVVVGDVAIVLDRIGRGSDGAVRSHYLILDFWATPANPLVAPIQASSDARAAGWFTLPELGQLQTTTNLAAYLEEALRRRAAGIPGCLVVGD